MAKQPKSQWDFGELFPAQPAPSRGSESAVAGKAPRILTVSELTSRVRSLLEQQIGAVWVTGEVTNLRVQSSGHAYFTLKDAGAQLNCVLFRGEPVGHRELLKDGQKLLLRGDLTVYEARGQYQLIVRGMELQGLGALQVAFEKLKEKLEAEGLFAQERKRPLPKYPERIGLITSPTGAAIRDVLHVIRRRNPSLEIILAPCRVQGEGAAREIAEAIRLLNEWSAAGEGADPGPAPVTAGTEEEATSPRLRPRIDLILLTRGGGSLEDLWAFNEEIVARAIFESRAPIVSAIGHEIDFTISDFVADLRAATPSVAAEIITEGFFSSWQFIAQAAARLRRLGAQQTGASRQRLDQILQRGERAHPSRRIGDWLQRVDELHSDLLRSVQGGAQRQAVAWRHLAGRLLRLRPLAVMVQRRSRFEGLARLLIERSGQNLRACKARLAQIESRLRLLGPEQVLARGYSITLDAKSGRVLRNVDEVQQGQKLRTRLKKGEVFSRAEKDAGPRRE